MNLWRRKAVCYLSNKHKLQIYSEMGQNWKLKRQKWSNGLLTILVLLHFNIASEHCELWSFSFLKRESRLLTSKSFDFKICLEYFYLKRYLWYQFEHFWVQWISNWLQSEQNFYKWKKINTLALSHNLNIYIIKF